MTNAKLIRESLTKLGHESLRRRQCPVRLAQNPRPIHKLAILRQAAHECHVVCTPGSGFGAAGEGYFRLSAFNSRENVNQAMKHIKEQLQT